MIARDLLARGRDVRILTRSSPAYQVLVDAGARPAPGDLKDPTCLHAICAGVDTLITTASAGSRGGADTPLAVDLEGNRHLIDAAKRAGVGHFIFISALNADEDSPIDLPRSKALTEEYLRRSGVPYTILAANGILEVMLGLIVDSRLAAERPVTIVGDGTHRHSFVSARDLAAFAVASVDNPAAMNRRVPIGGPKAVSWRDIHGVYEHVLGRPVPLVSVAPGELLPDLPPVPGLAEFLSGLLAVLETFDSPIEMTETARAFGVELTPLERVVQQAVAGLPVAARAG